MSDKITIYKLCRICEGTGKVMVTFTDGSENLLMCASCLGRGNFVWGWMEKDGEIDRILTK